MRQRGPRLIASLSDNPFAAGGHRIKNSRGRVHRRPATENRGWLQAYAPNPRTKQPFIKGFWKAQEMEVNWKMDSLYRE